MNDGNERRPDDIVAEGRASLEITDASGRVQANVPLKIEVGKRTRWTARGKTIESAHPEVRRYLRKTLHEMKPPPVPRDPLPVPKPARARPTGIPCPACRGKGRRREFISGDMVECGLCQGAGVTTEPMAAAWLAEFGDELA